MTALAGFWQAGSGDGTALAGHACERMLAAQAVYAPDAPSVRVDGAATLGRRLHRLVPEDAHDRGVLRDAAGRLLAADIRIDNRAELEAALGVERPAGVSDASLLGVALDRWGLGALDRVVGDFAFAWWDAPERRLVLARDFFGQRPLHFHRGDGFVAFASMPKGLHALPQIRRCADPHAAAAFLALQTETGGASFFEGIEKVASGHLVVIDGNGVRTRRYWRPEPRPLMLPHADDYAEAMREQMDRAVTARLRGAIDHVGSTLSGGLDSATVAATAARLLAPSGGRVTALTAVPRAGFKSDPRDFADEGPAAARVAALYPNVTHVRVENRGSPLAALDRDAYLYERPMLNICNGVWANALRDAARARGVRVLLTGAMGNASFSHHGFDRLHQLLAHGRLLTLGREALALRRRGTRVGTIANAALGPLLPDALRAGVLRFTGRRRRLSDYSLVTPEAVPDPASQPAAWPVGTPGAAQLGLFAATDYGNYTKGVLGGWGIDLRDPTADRRLVEFCLSVPPEQYLAGGITRALARRAFADRLPPETANETRKGYQGADWFEGLDADRAALADEIAHIGRDSLAAGLIDLPRARALLADWPVGAQWQRDDQVMHYRLALLRGVSTGHFLRKVSGVN
ncbi:MAG: asparagine synthase [Sphingomonas bacterium]|uniref:asparagine synthetase B family protein n=1 Tax=Sphingomonas bacterium TaxID=1895847 RepID=UPI00261B380F|nr:asparagine synthase-related protein [Sphingomonas bacterium]MDB5694915.1 asparagine synthase [Sphingomonas bacterium]